MSEQVLELPGVTEENWSEAAEQRGWGDGLPTVPPTPERVSAALAALDGIDLELGPMPPSGLVPTRESFAATGPGMVVLHFFSFHRRIRELKRFLPPLRRKVLLVVGVAPLAILFLDAFDASPGKHVLRLDARRSASTDPAPPGAALGLHHHHVRQRLSVGGFFR